MHVFWNFDFKGILNGFWAGFGKPKSRFGGQKPFKMRSQTHEIQYKVEVKKNSEKSKESEPAPWLLRGRPLKPEPAPGWCFDHILSKNKPPVQAGSKF